MSPTKTQTTATSNGKESATERLSRLSRETVRIETVTPKKAQEWLQGNVDNRRLRESRVLHLAKMLQLGEWDLTGDAIVFDDHGTLLNGQHRLSAVVVADIPARFVILRGVPAGAQEVMDQGLSRSLADQLHRRNVKYPFVVSGGLYWLYQLKYIEETGNVHYADPAMRPSMRELLQIFEQNLDLVEEAPRINKLVYYTKIRPGPTLAAYHRLLDIDRADAEEFFKRWQEGTDLPLTNPIWKLREFCLNDARLRGVRGRAPTYRYMAYVFKAWNYWREDAPMGQLQWKYSATQKEAWPVPH